tara:strand:+ start:382 stop:633 length:252 start_codon:yes stop_codon:yes gene_type:complete
MTVQTNQELKNDKFSKFYSTAKSETIFTKDYVDFLNEAGWRLEKKLPSNRNTYSDLLEDTEWKSNQSDFRCSRHYRRDLDALS